MSPIKVVDTPDGRRIEIEVDGVMQLRECYYQMPGRTSLGARAGVFGVGGYRPVLAGNEKLYESVCGGMAIVTFGDAKKKGAQVSLLDIEKKSLSTTWMINFLKKIGKEHPDNAPLSFTEIAEKAGVEDALYCLQALKGCEGQLKAFGLAQASKIAAYVDHSEVEKLLNGAKAVPVTDEEVPELKWRAYADSGEIGGRLKAGAWEAVRKEVLAEQLRDLVKLCRSLGDDCPSSIDVSAP